MYSSLYVDDNFNPPLMTVGFLRGISRGEMFDTFDEARLLCRAWKEQGKLNLILDLQGLPEDLLLMRDISVHTAPMEWYINRSAVLLSEDAQNTQAVYTLLDLMSVRAGFDFIVVPTLESALEQMYDNRMRDRITNIA